ncbi:MAG: PilZ domain-containing protein [Gammaproteobacteria bacterium]|nr:PilZ domain-containing protein [Gammaproteobacteria bacterium]
MEHRCGTRYALEYPVTLRLADSHSVSGVIGNLAAGGLLIQALSEPPPRHSLVEVVIHTPRALPGLWRWPAMVLRSGEDHAALMFDRLRFAELPDLLIAIREAQADDYWRPATAAARNHSSVGSMTARVRGSASG